MSGFDKFKHEPEINVITKETMEERIYKVFKILWKTLSKSFGPYGAPTIICYPSRHVTKDGFTIMKNTAFAADETKVDQTIANMAWEICNRLNCKVGDGTTSAIIATFTVFQSYMEQKKKLSEKQIMPRDIIDTYTTIMEKIIDRLNTKAVPMDKSTPETLYNSIKDIVNISSNGDEVITEMIANIYKELGTPGITIVNSPDGETKSHVIDGYKFNTRLLDRTYINNDNNTLDLDETDVIMFGTTVTESVLEKIIIPLNEECRFRGRHLLVCAPSYDEIMLRNKVAPMLNNEFRQLKSCNLVLSTYRAFNNYTRKIANDFSILMNTEILSKSRVDEIISKVTSGIPLTQIINIDERCIEGTRCLVKLGDGSKTVKYIYSKDNAKTVYPIFDEYDEASFPLGYTRNCSLGYGKDSSFTNLVYDEKYYKDTLKDAEDNLNEVIRKYEKQGRFNTEVAEAQERYYALRLKTGVIEVGGDSELSQTFLKDAVDDSVKAAESAFRNGVVHGCNIDLITSIDEILTEVDDELEKELLLILRDGFVNVYKTVLFNAYGDVSFDMNDRDAIINYLTSKFNIENSNTLKKDIDAYITERLKTYEYKKISLKSISNAILSLVDKNRMSVKLDDIIVYLSLKRNMVFDVSQGSFNNEVVNSLQTDKEILIATIDLIKMLITGNQMIVNVHHDFDYEK